MAGRGYSIFEPQRVTPTTDNEPQNILLPNGQTDLRSSGPYQDKRVFRLTVDLTNIFTDVVYNMQGTLLWFSGQNGGTAAPMYARLDNINNDPIQFVYDRAVSGIPFSKIFLSNPTAQPGVTAEFTIILDSPKDRVGLNG